MSTASTLTSLPDRAQIFRTAESVSPRHPDKICDQISDAILDFCLKYDKNSRVAVDCCGGHGELFITGEITSKAKLTEDVIRKIVARVNGKPLKTMINIAKQSPEIAQGVDIGGAGDQGIMIGYATDETPELLPLEYVLARSLNQFIYKKHPFDGKTQVTLQNGTMTAIVASWQHVSSVDLGKIIDEWYMTLGELHGKSAGTTKIYVNPAGDWAIGGFDADSGLTGRKLAVDNYGPRIPLGGGAFSGKDASKVDRSAAYMARKIATDYLKLVRDDCQKHDSCNNNFKGHHEVSVRLAYAIGVAEPLEKTVVIDGEMRAIPDGQYDLTPRGIIKNLDLLQLMYEKTAQYGHFGNGFNWDD